MHLNVHPATTNNVENCHDKMSQTLAHEHKTRHSNGTAQPEPRVLDHDGGITKVLVVVMIAVG